MKSNKSEEEIYDEQVEIFDGLVKRIEAQLDKFGRYVALEPGDYSIYEDYWGYPQVKVSMLSLKMLLPPVIEALQQVAKMYPGWEIVVAVVVVIGRWIESTARALGCQRVAKFRARVRACVPGPSRESYGASASINAACGLPQPVTRS